MAFAACALGALLPLACEPKLVVGKWTGGTGGISGGGSAGAGGAGGAGAGAGVSAGAGAGTAAISGAGASAGGEGGAGGEGTVVECHAGGDGNANASGGTPRFTGPVALPWSTSFENGFCDYATASGFCYDERRASYEVVTSPVHSGNSAAAFNIVVDTAFDGMQARCVRQGQLPDAAYYSAYFFIPTAPTAANNWNLIHFRGGGATGPYHGLWDVSVRVDADGSLHLFVFDFLRMLTREMTNLPAVPIGSWFQIEVYLKRAADRTGEFGLYQDGEAGIELTNLTTDDSSYGEWYVGNLAVELTPPDHTLYVDDVAIREAP